MSNSQPFREPAKFWAELKACSSESAWKEPRPTRPRGLKLAKVSPLSALRLLREKSSSRCEAMTSASRQVQISILPKSGSSIGTSRPTKPIPPQRGQFGSPMSMPGRRPAVCSGLSASLLFLLAIKFSKSFKRALSGSMVLVTSFFLPGF